MGVCPFLRCSQLNILVHSLAAPSDALFFSVWEPYLSCTCPEKSGHVTWSARLRWFVKMSNLLSKFLINYISTLNANNPWLFQIISRYLVFVVHIKLMMKVLVVDLGISGSFLLYICANELMAFSWNVMLVSLVFLHTGETISSPCVQWWWKWALSEWTWPDQQARSLVPWTRLNRHSFKDNGTLRHCSTFGHILN